MEHGTTLVLYNTSMTQSGAYEHNRRAALAAHAAYLQGSDQALFLAVCDRQCSAAARGAIDSSAQARGYGNVGTTWLQLDRAQPPLAGKELLSAIEGMDPLCLVVLGSGPLEAFAKAYRIERPAAGFAHVLGRPTCLVPDIDALLETEAGKQQLWSLMKALPALP